MRAPPCVGGTACTRERLGVVWLCKGTALRGLQATGWCPKPEVQSAHWGGEPSQGLTMRAGGDSNGGQSPSPLSVAQGRALW
jgi:hypothetical protein